VSGETGFLIRPGDLEALSARLTQLAESEELRERFGASGQDFVRRHFAVETMVESIYSLYVKLTASRN
jgi:glycosyltransferase involved in cell wall biosynthesis